MPVAAIDQGTTSTRALVVDDAGARIVRVAEHQQHYPQPGWVEHDAEELLRNVRDCIAACAESAPISALGIANQGESCLAWDADSGRAVSPVIVWQDARAREAVEKLRRGGAAELVAERAGLPLDAYFSAAKLAWLFAHIPAAQKLHRRGKLRLGTTDAFFFSRLTGRFVTDLATASRTALMNLRAGQWDADLCELFGVPMDALPAITATTGDFGAVAVGGRAIPVTAGVVDQQASLYGHGCRAPGEAKITFGTGAFALAVSGGEPPGAAARAAGLAPTVAWQLAGQAPVYALEGGVHCAGAAVNWARKLGLFESFAELNAFAGPPAIARDLVFVPALAGLACPHWDARAGGLWLGLSLDTGAPDLLQSLLEGIAFRAAEVVAAFAEVAPPAGAESALSVDGGVSANPYFCQFLANVLGRPVVVQACAELTALGAARLAGAAEFGGETPGKIYAPAEDFAGHKARFAEAVERAAKWR